MKKILMIPALVILTLTFAQAQSADIRTGEDVLRAMHDRYKTSWYQTVTFAQKSTTYKDDGTSTAETWYEAALIPGKLRIDIGPPANGNGFVLVNGNVTIVKDGKIAGTRKSVNMLLVLGFDVYRQDPETTIGVVKGEGFDLSKVQPARSDPKKLNDIRFTDYRPLAGAWIAARVEVYSDKKKVFSEDYTEIQANVKLEPAVFDPEQFSATHWEKP